MARNPTIMRVVAGALDDGAGRWLLQRRPANKRHGGLWEFPGGKIEEGETERAALARELGEELQIADAVIADDPVAEARGEAGEGEPAIVILLYKVDLWLGEPTAEPGAALSWVTPEEVATLPLPPLDRDLAEQLFRGA